MDNEVVDGGETDQGGGDESTAVRSSGAAVGAGDRQLDDLLSAVAVDAGIDGGVDGGREACDWIFPFLPRRAVCSLAAVAVTLLETRGLV